MTETVFQAAGLLRGSRAAALQHHLLREPGIRVVLFGHWLEMRAHAGASDAIHRYGAQQPVRLAAR